MTGKKTAGKSAGAKKAGKDKLDVEKAYPVKLFIAKLRRLADVLERGGRFTIQVAGERVSVPSDAVVNIERERGGDGEEIEFQLKWKN
jgi:amphi-Trp domain-containing protein